MRSGLAFISIFLAASLPGISPRAGAAETPAPRASELKILGPDFAGHWIYRQVPAGAELRFSLGMSDCAPGRSDGVWFKVFAAEVSGELAGIFTSLFKRNTAAHA